MNRWWLCTSLLGLFWTVAQVPVMLSLPWDFRLINVAAFGFCAAGFALALINARGAHCTDKLIEELMDTRLRFEEIRRG